ncbi:MAG: nucleotidyltransferase family protein [Oscillospiraceae bacterium]|nr:nucleotidyltransferase family protein [Oscillospiraceae bacterium]
MQVSEMLSDITAVVLAAGYSSRMGEFKPALMIGQDSVIDLTVGNFVSAGIKDIVVVTGYRAEDIGSALYFRDGVRFAHNAGFDAGMFTSVKTGVSAIGEGRRAFLLSPADCAGFAPSTVTALIEEFGRSGAPVVYPEYDSRRRGHPSLISAEVIPEILTEPDESNLRAVLSRYDGRAAQTRVDDPGVTMDMDTPEEFERMCGYIGRRWDRDTALALAMQKIASQTELCSAVITAELAYRAANALRNSKLMIDVELVYAASLLYRVCDDPADAMSFLFSQNLPKHGQIAGAREHPEKLAADPMSEAAIVYLTDSVIREADSPEALEIKNVADAVAGHDVFAGGEEHHHHHHHT